MSPKIPPRKEQVKAVQDMVKKVGHKMVDPYVEFFKNFPWERLKEEPKMNLFERLRSNKQRTEDAIKDIDSIK